MKSFSGFTLVEIRFLYSKLNVSGSHEIFLGAFPVYKFSSYAKKFSLPTEILEESNSYKQTSGSWKEE